MFDEKFFLEVTEKTDVGMTDYYGNIVIYRHFITYLLQTNASLVAQLVKLPAKWETWVRSVGWEDPLEEGMAIHSSILALKIPMDRRAWQAAVHGIGKGRT